MNHLFSLSSGVSGGKGGGACSSLFCYRPHHRTITSNRIIIHSELTSTSISRTLTRRGRENLSIRAAQQQKRRKREGDRDNGPATPPPLPSSSSSSSSPPPPSSSSSTLTNKDPRPHIPVLLQEIRDCFKDVKCVLITQYPPPPCYPLLATHSPTSFFHLFCSTYFYLGCLCM